MTKVIAIAHEKGGVGKTTTAINLGIGLARQGKNVLLLDADPQGDLTKCLGVKDPKALPWRGGQAFRFCLHRRHPAA